jgi:hypothetical protein
MPGRRTLTPNEHNIKALATCAIHLPETPIGRRLVQSYEGNVPLKQARLENVENMKNRVISSVLASLAVVVVGHFVPNSAIGAELSTPAAAQAPAPALAPGVSQVVKMYQGGIHKDVILNYINNTAAPCRLDADGILYLQSAGVPQEITQALITRDGQLQQLAMANAAAMAASGQAAYGTQNAQVVTPTTPPPDVSDYGDYGGYPFYSGYPYYPYYGYPYFYGAYGWPGWGWGYYGRGFRGYGGFRGGFPAVRGGFGGFHGGFRGGFGGFRGGGVHAAFAGRGGFGGGHGGFSGGHGGFGGGHGGGGHR